MRRLALLVAFVLLGCGGDPFEPSSFADSSLAGAQSSAGAQAVGSSAGLSGVAGAGAGGVASGNDAGNDAGGAGSAGEPGEVLGGAAGVDSGGAPSIHLACATSAWKPSAFASRAAELPTAATDGDASSRWSSGQAREIGQWFALELGAGVVLERLELGNESAPNDVPNALALELDGKRVDVVTTTPAPGRLVLAFAPTQASSARLVLTSSAPTWWSIAELAGGCIQ